MSTIHVLKADALSQAMSKQGFTRHIAFKEDGYLVVRARGEPWSISVWHHHGDYDVYGYLVSGSGRFENNIRKEEDSVSLRKGDFFHVPHHTVHREINPSSKEGNEFNLFLSGTGPMVFDLEDTGHD
jgi:mannose-6-phosphate isomerase-like protein (cupin superfamily)